MTKHTIEMDTPTKAFYNGVSVATDVRKTLDEMPGFEQLPFEQQLSMFWLFVGLNADRDLAGVEQETFIRGVGTRALQRSDELVLEISTSNADFHAEDEDGDHNAARADALNRILRQMVKQDVFGWTDEGTVADANGHRVGTWKIHD